MASTTIVNSISKSGGVATGAIAVKLNSVDTQSLSAVSHDFFYLTDKNDLQFGVIRGSTTADGTSYVKLVARKPKADGSGTWAKSIDIGIDNDGNTKYQITDPAVFREALQVTPANIGAMPQASLHSTGDLTLSNNGVTSNSWFSSLTWRDKNKYPSSTIQGILYSNGDTGLFLGSENRGSSGQQVANGGIIIKAKKTGEITYELNYPENFRSAIQAPAQQQLSGVDLDNLTAPGIYYVSGATCATSSETNLSANIIVSGNNDGTRVMQLRVGAGGSALMWRSKAGTPAAWNAWHTL